ncbi:hypothetical protein [Denitratisoma oestradiolicum]|uniref:Uncharacterized protein n=1 Tax=Denitratisoma oestradiolicum TaxID=311182 RepID=A0A6S6YPY6_9PROT|nr:hypothetical protein [Denitratisoma oestradiolicum]TWO80054.1 hypothetical protein CBW56_12135 [Denitratisoma oestradiolicum]CAB1369830.1 conserved protein of unknown function [Denitratisoma oestradiolicum]
MAFKDPAERALLRFEARRYANRCGNQEGMIERADTLREVCRLTNMPIPATLMEVSEALDARRRLILIAEQRAKTLITDQIAAWSKADEQRRGKLQVTMIDDWTNLTGHMGHLRTWAQRQFMLAQQLEQ